MFSSVKRPRPRSRFRASLSPRWMPSNISQPGVPADRGNAHLEAANMLLPRAQALSWLWERAFRGDDQAHERVHTVLTQEGGGPGYTSALESELSRCAEALFAARWQEVPRVVQNLRRYA